jgi:hypothetical protein
MALGSDGDESQMTRKWTASIKLQEVPSGAIFENAKPLVSGSCGFFVGTVHPVDVLLPLQEYRDLGQTVARLQVTSSHAEMTYFRHQCTVDGQPFQKGELTFGGHDVTMEAHRFQITLMVTEDMASEAPGPGVLQYRIYHPDDAPSSPDRRSALVSLQATYYDRPGPVTLEGDATVIRRALEAVLFGPDGILSTAWLTRIHPAELQRGMRSGTFAPFRPELVAGAEVFQHRAPPLLQGDDLAHGFVETFATDLVYGTSRPERMSPEERERELRRLNAKIWDWQHWRPTQASSESAAVTLARRLPEQIVREQARYARRPRPAAGAESVRNPPLVESPVTESQALALARALVAAYEAARLDDPGALPDDLRRRVQDLNLS